MRTVVCEGARSVLGPPCHLAGTLPVSTVLMRRRTKRSSNDKKLPCVTRTCFSFCYHDKTRRSDQDSGPKHQGAQIARPGFSRLMKVPSQRADATPFRQKKRTASRGFPEVIDRGPDRPVPGPPHSLGPCAAGLNPPGKFTSAELAWPHPAIIGARFPAFCFTHWMPRLVPPVRRVKRKPVFPARSPGP